MPYARRWKWVQSLTGADTQRKAAAVIGVNQSTLSRWMRAGIPVPVLIDLIVTFGCDPVESMVVWGYLRDSDIVKLNYEAMAQYLPVDVLARELSRRASIYAEERPDTERKTSAGMLRRA